MRRLIFLDSARDDLVAILEYITRESGSRTVGRGFAEVLQHQCRKLASLPGTLGRARPELAEGMRSFAFKGYVIFFRYGEDTVEVINLLEGHRDVVAYFHDDPEASR
ncbi:type II toxin-antitoxin system RelE/ParE family toxin [Nitrospirillum sp. BR 11828]|uniref:type II toxin-antitoxin system RelE/ParE family toxin n=1 Tax=Nitrospirillum sp. BR 11828 TaxID=3104325 RepID=UPI002ACAD77F|nr:type II toxin-antitoxin system RelE/ParE family toxin [Nitrospirillum sp. BR 11828]MDZ5645932.1 type II toxin-antitoxin system RelE/ParE family toxin [Nitrospirillum sp. BR 11828]